ncbi:MAG: hypothetical protein WBA17_11855 [Saprospiraceae bacterium]
MNGNEPYTFSAKIDIIGINPFVFVPEVILDGLFIKANKRKGHIPIRGTINGNDGRKPDCRTKFLKNRSHMVLSWANRAVTLTSVSYADFSLRQIGLRPMTIGKL